MCGLLQRDLPVESPRMDVRALAEGPARSNPRTWLCGLLRRTRPKEQTTMWYFAWILGTGLASLAAVLNGMWFEMREEDAPGNGR
ncbi:hypothetical protein GCM10009090_24040 [[Pseudomonas] boreopolis]|uniref:Cyd operon protein YbgT n=1 Tax=Xanthomonas boreopolis TaxID=86183 RepID=A0A919KII0_9XANT|nr:hypothetical protein GCM10009090_24040 [[Pseudomonas] boreopolis]